MNRFTAFLRQIKTFPGRTWAFVKRRPKTSVGVGLGALLVVFAVVAFSQPKAPEYLTELARQGDLQQTVEAVGTVISERDLKLQFPITGIIDQVLVQEGDEVKARQILARIRASGLQADVNSASAQVASAQADLNKLLEGTRPEEIAITEASVQNKRAALKAAQETQKKSEEDVKQSERQLEALRAEAAVSLSGYVASAGSDVSSNLSTANTSVQAMSDVLENVDVSDAFAKHNIEAYRSLQQQQLQAETAISQTQAAIPSITDYASALAALDKARAGISQTSSFINQLYSAVSGLPVTSTFSITDREDNKTAIAAQLTKIQSAVSAIDSSLKSLRDASANFDTRIRAEESAVISAEGSRDKATADILTYETSLRIEEANLALQRAGSRQTDIDAARARLNQYYAQLQRARDRYEDTIIRAPIDGTVTKVNLKEGELLSTSFESESAIAMLGSSPYRVEMYVAEIDVPRVQVTQTGSIELDAFPGEDFLLTVSELNPTSTDVDGVSKYRVKLDFLGDATQLRIGMTGDAEIFTDSRKDVIIIPGRAVLNEVSGSGTVRILKEDGTMEERSVTLGMEGQGGDVEVIKGVREGEQVIVLIKE